MQRQNFRNISNNFIQGGTIQPGLPLQSNANQPQTRQTRSSNIAPNPAAVQPTQPLTKIEPTTPVMASTSQQPVAVPQVVAPVKSDESTTDIRTISEDDLLRLKKINFKKKVSGKEKRLRQNRKLFRMLTPRNAIAALNELHGQSVNESVVVPTQGNKFEAEITINNVRYTGVGNSKMQAKNAASEKALRDLVINKFQQIKNQEATATPVATDDDVSMDGEKDDDVPMLQLASFALHKLFSEWEAEGFEIPLPKSNPEPAPVTPGVVVEPKQATPKIRCELPPNNETMHPVMLLSIMRPCTAYSDLGSVGITPNIQHTVGATVDGEKFIGQGRSKKEARKKVATEILIKLFQWKGSCC